MKILYGGKLVHDGQILAGKAVLFDDKIRAIVEESEIGRFDAEKIPYTGILMPGFIDIHIHGAAGADVMDGSLEALDAMAKSIIRGGTTSFLATTMTMPEKTIVRSLNAVRSFMSTQTQGATCLGVHLEGPFINPAYSGAQNKAYIQPPSRRWLDPFLDIIKIITLAPEMDKDLRFVKSLKDRVVLSIGHSGADYDTALRSFEAGIQHVTHCFNAMTPFHHRDPGIVGAALTQPVSIELITDGVHVHPDLFPLVIQQKGIDHLICVTDAMRATYLKDGKYDLGDQSVMVTRNVARLPSGTIAGSVHRLDRAYRNILAHTTCSIADVAHMLSTSAAQLLKIDHVKGHIREGYDADLVIMDEMAVREVFISGVRQPMET